MKPKRDMRASRLAIVPLLFFTALWCGCGSNPVAPDGFVGQTIGCGNFSVYRFNAEMTDAILVQATANDLELGRTPVEFKLPHESLNVRIERFSGRAEQYYCDDVFGDDPEITDTYRAVSGTVRIAVGDTIYVDPSGFMTAYRVNVSLIDVQFEDGDGTRVDVPEADFGEITVGWLPG